MAVKTFPSTAGASGVNYFTPTLTNRASTTVESVVAQFTLPANELAVGRAYVIRVISLPGAGGSENAKVRIGTLGTIADAQAVGTQLSTATVGSYITYDALIRCSAAGVSGAIGGGGNLAMFTAFATTPSANASATVDTTAALFVSVTATAGTAQTLTVTAASLVRVS